MKRRPTAIRRSITADDLFKLKVLTGLSLAPDEKKVAYTVEQVDFDANKYFTNIHMLDLATGKSDQFTHGQNGDGHPVWSKDSTRIAFTSSRDKKSGVYVMPASGGAEKKVFEAEAMIGDLIWHPDGKHILLCLRYKDSHFVTDEKKKNEPPVYRHITRLFYRLDGLGFLPQDPWQIYALNVETGLLRKLTSGKRDNHSPALSPDGQTVAFVSNRAKDPDIDSLRDDIFLIPFKGGKEKLLATPAGPKAGLTFSPNGKLIGYIGHANPNDAWGVTNHHVWVVGVNGAPKARDLMPKFDRMAYDQSIADMEDVHGSAQLYWSGDGKRLFFLSSDTGATNIYYVPLSGGKPTRIFKGKCHVKSLSMNGAGKIATFTYADLENPGELMTCVTQYGGEVKAKRHTDLNPQLKTTIRLGHTRDVMFKSFDGTEVQGFLVTPPGFKSTRKYPAILEIHGGPRTQYAYTFFHEMQLLAANGYVVFYTNPRGGSGRGETWADAIAGGWGDLDYKDCMAAADYMEKLKFVDKKRIGVTGGSYGGWMTNWIIGHTHRFKAAVTQRSVTDLIAMTGSSDIGYALNREFNGYPWTNFENYRNCSPMYYLEKVKTPVLILHNERDLRCHIEQAEQMFVKLKVLGKTVEFVRFPDEPHGLSRHGRPDRRKARLEWILKWFNRYLR